MSGLKVLTVLALCLSWSHCKLYNTYCSLCRNHTLCQYQGYGENCENIGGGGVTELEKIEIVDLHNWMRSLVAGGHESRGIGGRQPKAANMMKMVWDNDLQIVAQRWADQCRFEHDTCRDDFRWKVGQNLFWKSMYPVHHVNWTEAIFSWYNEVLEYNPSEISRYRFEFNTGHYTQMMWHHTYAVGCGRRDYGYNKLYVCNYGPVGNWIGEPLYEIGEPCSKCPNGTICEGYLCALPSAENSVQDQFLHKRQLEKEGLNLRTGSETEKVEELKPKDDKPEKPEKCTCTCPAPKGKDDIQNTENQSKTNEIDLDGDVAKEIDQIKYLIDNLAKNLVKKNKTTN